MHCICLFRDALDTNSCACRWLRHDTNPIWRDKTHPVVCPDWAAHRIASTFSPPFPQPRDTACLQATHIQKAPAQAGTPKLTQHSAIVMSLYHAWSPTQVFNLTRHRTTWSSAGLFRYVFSPMLALTAGKRSAFLGICNLTTDSAELQTACTFLSTQTIYLPAN